MKDNVAWACLLLCWLPLAAAGQIRMIQQFGGTQFGGNSTAKPEVMPESRTDVLQFVDGSALHGQLSRMDLDHGLAWVTPEAKNPIRFRPDHVNFIRFAHAQDVRVAPSCHLRFGNGDDLYGSISTLDNQRLGFKTWFGGDMAIPRPALRSITFLSSNYAVAYDGPYDAGGWTILNISPDSWTFHDGAFIGSGTGVLGRDLRLTNSVTMEFDLAWTGSFNLQVCLYCDAQERMDVASGACAVDFTPRQVNLRQAQNMGAVFNLAGVPLALEAGKSRMHAAIQCDKTEGTVSVFVNNQLIKIWKDCDFSNAGTGVFFVKNYGYFNIQNGFGNSGTVQLSRLKISQWQGRFEPETFVPATNTDSIRFVNHDRAAGKIQAIQDGKIKLALAGTELEIPLARVAEIDFAETNAAAEPAGPWVARAHFPGGGSLSFQLEKWDDWTISGRSAIFGPLALQSAAVREIEFNLDRPKEDGVTAAVREFEELDE
jgi:hypothetical protein